jgi:hypothetical protein
MNDDTPQPDDPDNRPGRSSPALALFMAFVPAAILLSLMTFAPKASHELLMFGFIMSIIFCFISSFMIFARRTGLAIVVGLCFLVLNGLIVLFLGCASMFHF